MRINIFTIGITDFVDLISSLEFKVMLNYLLHFFLYCLHLLINSAHNIGKWLFIIGSQCCFVPSIENLKG